MHFARLAGFHARGRPRCAGPCGSGDDARAAQAPAAPGSECAGRQPCASDRMMMLTPSRTAASARPHSSSTPQPPGRRRPCWRTDRSVERQRAGSDRRSSPRSQRIFSRSSLVRIGWRTSRRLVFDVPSMVEQVRPRPDDRDEAHHELFADRIDRRVRDLGEVLLEVGEQQLRLVRQRRDRRVGAHRADGFLAGRRPSASSASSGLPACSRTPAGDRAAAGSTSRLAPARPAALPARSACGRSHSL